MRVRIRSVGWVMVLVESDYGQEQRDSLVPGSALLEDWNGRSGIKVLMKDDDYYVVSATENSWTDNKLDPRQQASTSPETN